MNTVFKTAIIFLCLPSLGSAFMLPFWLESPNRSNPHDPRSSLFQAPPQNTPTPYQSPTITPTFSISPTFTVSPTMTATPLPAGSPATYTIKDWQGSVVAGAVVMVNNDASRTGVTDAAGHCSINITSTSVPYTLTCFAPPDGGGYPSMIPGVFVAHGVSGNAVTMGGVLRPRPAVLWGDIVLNSVSNTVSPANTLMVTWQPAFGDPLGTAQYIPISGLPMTITKVARAGSAQAVLIELDPAGNTVSAAWVPLSYPASGTSFSTGMGTDFLVNVRTYQAFTPVSPLLTSFRGFMEPFNFIGGAFQGGKGALYPPPSVTVPSPQTETDIFPLSGAGNHHPTMAGWGASGGFFYFSWQLFQTSFTSDFTPSPFYLRVPPTINTTPAGSDKFQSSNATASDWTWAIISTSGADPYPSFYPEDEIMRLTNGLPGPVYDWSLPSTYPAGISALNYGLQTGVTYKLTVGDTNWYDFPSCLAGNQLLYVLAVSVTSTDFTH